MKAYLGITGALFAILTLLHLARIVLELRQRFPTEPGFVLSYGLLTLGTGALAVWAWRLFQRTPSSITTPGQKL
jgi:hypothetical protein